MAKQKRRIQYDDFVSDIRSDGSTNPLVLIQGFVGKASENGYIRVYLDAALNNFIDVLEEDVIHANALPKEEASLGGSLLWIREDTEFKYGDPKTRNRPTSTFLQGDLLQAYQRDAAKIAGGAINHISPGLVKTCHNFITGGGCQYIWTNTCRNFATNDCSFLISRCGNIHSFNTCGVTRTYVPPPTCQNTVTVVPTTCLTLQSRTCGHTVSYAPPTCGSTRSIACGTTVTLVPTTDPTGCGLAHSTLPPTTFRTDTVVAQTGTLVAQAATYGRAPGVATGFETYNPYGY